MSSLPAELPRLRELIAEHEAKANGGQITRETPDGMIEVIAEYSGVDAEIAAFQAATSTLKRNCQIGTRYVGNVFSTDPRISAQQVKQQLLQSAWWQVYEGLQIEAVAPAGDRSKLEQIITGHCPAFTIENIREHFGPYLLDPRQHLLRGLAEQFVKLDPAFKSHDKMKIGVKGLPKRIIMTGCAEDCVYRNNGAERLMDVINAVRAYAGQPRMDRSAISAFMQSAIRDDGIIDGFKLRRFGNGNAHLLIDPDTLVTINKALAEYYGDVVADCPEATDDIRHAKGTAVSKDLQFYRTPQAAANLLVSHAGPTQRYDQRDVPLKVLEPSCGDGAILDAMRRYVGNPDRSVKISAFGIEVSPERAEQARAKGHSVMCANFLQVAPNQIYDMVLMNPPFYGKHYQQHVNHARKFLKPSGVLYAILPVTAVTDHGFINPDRGGWGSWRDLPVGAFSESGTNINTGIARLFAGDRSP